MADNCKIPCTEPPLCRVGALRETSDGGLHAGKRPGAVLSDNEGATETGALAGCPETNLVMQIGWRDCLLWSISSKEPNFLAAFTTETGLSFPPSPKSALEAMIDEATGVNEAVAVRYVEWFNANVWGDSSLDPDGDE